jgi:predicted alpha/beta-fold hydrolase
LVHGLGGSVSSYYMERTAIAAHQAGMGCLRFHLRGADREGQDIYHAGLTADLEAALASPELAIFETLYVLGFSLGGNTALLWARSPTNPRVKAVATVCSPLDLDASCHFIDRPSSVLYRHYILDSLKEMYAEVASRWPVPIPVREARKIHYLREWDERMVSPYHGFAGADDYYRQTSAAYALPELAIPALVVAAENDPIVGASTIQPSLDGNLPGVEVHWLGRGGHVGCPPNIDLGQGSPVGLEAQILTWFRATAAAAS